MRHFLADFLGNCAIVFPICPLLLQKCAFRYLRAYTPAPPNTAPPAQPNPASVNLYDNIERLNLAVDQILPLHGRKVPLAELQQWIGKAS
jgi:hypothetical protein